MPRKRIEEESNEILTADTITGEDMTLIKKYDALDSQREGIFKEIENAKALKKQSEQEYTNLCRDINAKERTLNYLVAEIQAQNYAAQKARDLVRKEREKEIKYIEDTLKKTQEADAQYKALLAENTELNKNLKHKEEELRQLEAELRKENERWQRHAQQVEGEAKRRETDVQEREAALKAREEEFEAYKSTIEPDLARMSAIKNENTALLAELEDAKKEIENQRLLIQAEKVKNQGDLEAERERIRKAEAVVREREARLQKAEENLKDMELEAKAAIAEANRTIKRYQNEKAIKGE